MISLPWVTTLRRQRTSPAASCGCGGAWTLALVVGLLWPATPICAVYLVNASSSTSAEHHSSPSPSSTRRCAPISHDVLWIRLKLPVPHLMLLGNSDHDDDDDDDNDDDEVEVSRKHLSPAGDHQLSSVGDISQTLATSSDQRGRHRLQRWRRGGSEGRRKPGRRRSAPTSWSCRLQTRWKRMPRGVFPTYVQTGSCRGQPTCVLGMYACRPRRYRIKVLRRISDDDADDGCRPVPVVGPEVLYEEAWSLADVPVTVACECSRRRRSGTYYHQSTDDR